MSDAYLRGVDREQVLLLPERIEDYVGANSIVRVIPLDQASPLPRYQIDI